MPVGDASQGRSRPTGGDHGAAVVTHRRSPTCRHRDSMIVGGGGGARGGGGALIPGVGGHCVPVTSPSVPVVADNRPRPGDPLDPDAAISVRGLVKRYGDRTAVDGLDLDIRRGEIFALLGPNGAGKTTTVEVLEGYRQRDGGAVQVLGCDPGDHSAALRARVGIVLQSCGTYPHLSV